MNTKNKTMISILEVLVSITIAIIISLYLIKPMIKEFYIISETTNTITKIQNERCKEYERIYGR